MKFKYTKPISLLLTLILVLAPLLSSQAQVVSVMTMGSATSSTQIQHQNHQHQTLKNTPTTKHCVLNLPLVKDNDCMSDDGGCPNHMSCCSIIGAILSTNVVAFDLTTTPYLISEPQRIVFLPLPAEIKPPR